MIKRFWKWVICPGEIGFRNWWAYIMAKEESEFDSFKEFKIVNDGTLRAWKKKNFKCVWCARSFIIGDEFNFLYTNTNKPEDEHISGNPIICKSCYENNTEIELKDELRKRYFEFMNDRYWWFRNDK